MENIQSQSLLVYDNNSSYMNTGVNRSSLGVQ